MTAQYTYSSVRTFYWVFPEGNPWSLSLIDEPQPTDMTKSELIKTIATSPDDIPMYVVDGRGWCGSFDVSIVRDMDGDVAEIHLNIQ